MSSKTLLGSGQITCDLNTCDFCLNHYTYLQKYKEYLYCEFCLYKFLEKNHFEFYSKTGRTYSYELNNKTTDVNNG